MILRTIAPPSMEQFDQLIDCSRKAVRRARMKRSDVKAAVAKVRLGRRRETR